MINFGSRLVRAVYLYFALNQLFHYRQGIHNPFTWWKLAKYEIRKIG